MITLDKMKEQLTTLTVSVAALNANHKALKEQLERIEQSQVRLDGYFKELVPHIVTIEQSQGKLLAAINERNEGNQIDHGFFMERLHTFDAKLDGIRDGLCDEISAMHTDLELRIKALPVRTFKAKRPRKRKRK